MTETNLVEMKKENVPQTLLVLLLKAKSSKLKKKKGGGSFSEVC